MADLNDDIKKYLAGELSPEARHALERKALDDPFLSDALDGAGFVSPAEFTEDLKVLEAAVNDRIGRSKAKVVPLWNWSARIAAGFMLVAISTFIVLQIFRNDSHPGELAESKQDPTMPIAKDSVTTGDKKNKSEREEMVTAKPNEDSAAGQDKLLSLSEQKAFEPAPATKERVPTAAASPALSQAAEEAPAGSSATGSTSVKVDDAPPPEKPAEVAAIQAEAAFEDEENATSPASGYVSNDKAKKAAGENAATASRLKNVAKKIIRGQVTGDDGQGLPGVNVIIKGTNSGTVTNAMGYYEIPADQADETLVFSFIGMESVEVATGTSQELNVSMNPDMTSLSEVVVVGYGSEKETDKPLSTFEFAAPTGGRSAFKRYLETSLHYPEIALQNEVEGKVTIQFTVETTGRLSDFKVVKGIGSGCEEEVIRLIKQGPAWGPTKRDDEPVKDKVKVRVKFRLPKK